MSQSSFWNIGMCLCNQVFVAVISVIFFYRTKVNFRVVRGEIRVLSQSLLKDFIDYILPCYSFCHSLHFAMLCIKKLTISDLLSNINNASIQIRKISKLETITLKIQKDNLKKKLFTKSIRKAFNRKA